MFSHFQLLAGWEGGGGGGLCPGIEHNRIILYLTTLQFIRSIKKTTTTTTNKKQQKKTLNKPN